MAYITRRTNQECCVSATRKTVKYLDLEEKVVWEKMVQFSAFILQGEWPMSIRSIAMRMNLNAVVITFDTRGYKWALDDLFTATVTVTRNMDETDMMVEATKIRSRIELEISRAHPPSPVVHGTRNTAG
jgi:hypothetical protein